MASQGDRFRRRALNRGYKVDEVDAFLDRVEATLSGEPIGSPMTSQEVDDVVFRVRFGGYDEWQVDVYLDRVARQLSDLEERGVLGRAPSPEFAGGPAAQPDGPGRGMGGGFDGPPMGGPPMREMPEPGGFGGDDGMTRAVPMGPRDSLPPMRGPMSPPRDMMRDAPVSPPPRDMPMREAPVSPPHGDMPMRGGPMGPPPMDGPMSPPRGPMSPPRGPMSPPRDNGMPPRDMPMRGGPDPTMMINQVSPPMRDEPPTPPPMNRRQDPPQGGRFDRAPAPPPPIEDDGESFAHLRADDGEGFGHLRGGGDFDDPFPDHPRRGAPGGGFDRPNDGPPPGVPERPDPPGRFEATMPISRAGGFGGPGGPGGPPPPGDRFGGPQEPPHRFGPEPERQPSPPRDPDMGRPGGMLPPPPPAPPTVPPPGQWNGDRPPQGGFGRGPEPFDPGAEMTRPLRRPPMEDPPPTVSDSELTQRLRRGGEDRFAPPPPPPPARSGPNLPPPPGGAPGDRTPPRGIGGDNNATQPHPVVPGSGRPASPYDDPQGFREAPTPPTGFERVADNGRRNPYEGRGMFDEPGRHGRDEMTTEMNAGDSPFTPQDLQRVSQLRNSFQPRRFGSGYDPVQVGKMFDAMVANMTGRAPVPVTDRELDTGQFSLVQQGYFEPEVDAAVREVRDIFANRGMVR